MEDSINAKEDDLILTAIKFFENHRSIIKIKESNTTNFSFKLVLQSQVHDEIIALNSLKACPKESIPPKIIKESCDILTTKLSNDINYSRRYGQLPNDINYSRRYGQLPNDINYSRRYGQLPNDINYSRR